MHHLRAGNPTISQEKVSKWELRNNSSQIYEGFSGQHLDQVVQSNRSMKNESNLGPSFLSITYKEPKTDPTKHKVSCKRVAQKPCIYKPPLILSQPKYFPTDKGSETKSLEQVKHINKKYSFVDKCKSKPFKESNKSKFKHLKLCNEGKLAKELGLLRPLKEALVHQSINSRGVNRNERQLTECVINTCRSRSEMSNCKTLKHTNHDKNLSIVVDSNMPKCNNENYSSEDIHKNHNYPQCLGQSLCCSTKKHVCPALKPCCMCEMDNHFSTDVDQSNIDLLDRMGKCPNNVSCLLHNTVEYRQKNQSETHHLHPKPKHSESKPTCQTYILDERLFPVHLGDHFDVKDEDTTVHTIPLFNHAEHSVFSKALVTLKQTENRPQAVRFGSRLNNANNPKTNKTEEIYHHKLIPAPTNSLALKHQRGVMGS